jgi:hypothetical protein
MSHSPSYTLEEHLDREVSRIQSYTLEEIQKEIRDCQDTIERNGGYDDYADMLLLELRDEYYKRMYPSAENDNA